MRRARMCSWGAPPASACSAKCSSAASRPESRRSQALLDVQSFLPVPGFPGRQSVLCLHAWSNPTYNVFGWQRPCYLLSDEGYAPTYKSLIEDTEWSKYGIGNNAKCNNCMAHCGFEGTAVNDAFRHPLKALLTSLRGPKVSGPMAPDLALNLESGSAPAARDHDFSGRHQTSRSQDRG